MPFHDINNGQGIAEALSQLTGWVQYNDTQYTSGSPFVISADTETDLPNNAGSIIDSQKPTDVATFYDGSTITGRNGDDIIILLRFKVTPTTVAATFIDVSIDIGDGVTPNVVFRDTKPFPKGANVERDVNVTFSGYTLGTWEANGGVIKVNSDGPCDIYDIGYVIKRTHKAR